MALPRYLIAPARRLYLLTAPQAPTWISASPERRQNTALPPTRRRKFPVFTGAKCRRPLFQSQATAATASRRGSRAASTGKPFPRPGGAAAGTALSDPGWHKTRGAGDDVPRVQAVLARAVPTPAASPDPQEPPALRPGRGAVEPTLLPRWIGRGRRPGRAHRRPPGLQHSLRRGARSLPPPFLCRKVGIPPGVTYREL